MASDIILETRVKVEDLYKALMYMKEIGARPKSRSAVASQAISLISSLYEGPVPEIEQMLYEIKEEFGIKLTTGFAPSGRSSISASFKRRMQAEALSETHISDEEYKGEEHLKNMMERLLKGGKV